MEKTIQFKVAAPRILRFFSEGRHKKASRTYVDPLANFDERVLSKPVAGIISYSWSVSYTWVPSEFRGIAPEPGYAGVRPLTCPCGATI